MTFDREELGGVEADVKWGAASRTANFNSVAKGDDCMIPRIKEAYPIYWLDSETVRIGAQEGLTRQYRDPDGQLRFLLDTMDGARRLDEVIEIVRNRFPELTEDAVQAGVQELIDGSFVEDVSFVECPERFSVNQRFFQAAKPTPTGPNVQHVLQRSAVGVFGIGGASALLPQLAALGIGRLRILDFDSVDTSNLNRQFLFPEDSVGRLKVDIAKDVLSALTSFTQVEVVPLRIGSVADARDASEGLDLLVCGMDEPAFTIQRIVNAAAVQQDIPAVYLLTQVTKGRLFSVRPRVDGCIDCLHLYYTDRDQNFARQFEALIRTPRQGETAAIAPHIARLTSYGSDEVVRLLTGYAAPLANSRQFEVDYLTGESRVLVQWPRSPNCPSCGTGREEDTRSLAAFPIYGENEYP